MEVKPTYMMCGHEARLLDCGIYECRWGELDMCGHMRCDKDMDSQHAPKNHCTHYDHYGRNYKCCWCKAQRIKDDN